MAKSTNNIEKMSEKKNLSVKLSFWKKITKTRVDSLQEINFTVFKWIDVMFIFEKKLVKFQCESIHF